jgi:hypothetical protein
MQALGSRNRSARRIAGQLRWLSGSPLTPSTWPEAPTRLRARAYSLRRAVADVAADVVARRMRFDDNAD